MNIVDRFSIPGGLVLIGLGLFWGAGFPAIEIVVAQIPPLLAAGIRYGVSGCIVLCYAWLTTTRVRPDSADQLIGILIIGAFMFAGYQAGLYIGTQYITGATAAVVTTMSPVMAALIAVPVLGESRGIPDLIGFCLGVGGVLVLSQPSVGTSTVSSTAIGVGLVFVGATLFATGSVTVQLFDGKLPIEALLGWAMIVGTLILFIFSFIRGESVPAMSSLTPTGIFSLLYITIISGAIGYLVYFQLVQRIGATETTLVAYIEPVAATVVAVTFLSQSIDITMVIGFLAVATGFTIVSRRTMRQVIISFRETHLPKSPDHK